MPIKGPLGPIQMKTTSPRPTPKLRRRLILAALAAGLFLLCAAAGWKAWVREPRIEYVTIAVTSQDVELTVLASGTVRASALVSVGAQVSGQIIAMNARLGERVRKGQVLAQIESLPQVNALRTAEAQLASVRAQLRGGQATLAQAARALQRQREMFARDAIAQQDLETAQTAYAVAQASDAALATQIDTAQLAVDTARLNLSYTRIIAPTDGMVVAVMAVAGQTVNANQTTPNIVKIANLNTVNIRVRISEADVNRVKPGQRASFTAQGDALRRYETELLAIEPAPDAMANDASASGGPESASAVYYNALMAVPNADGHLRIGMTVQVNIVLARAVQALVVPSSALLPGSQGVQGTVRLLDAAGKPVLRRVRIGLDNNSSAQVLEGLQLGDRVIVGESAAGKMPPGAAAPHWGPGA